MSSFFDKLSIGAANAGRTISQKVKNTSDISKLTNEINTERKSIQQNLNAIGKLYYDIQKDNPDPGFKELVDAITASEAHIVELQQNVEAVRAREPELMTAPEEMTAKTSSIPPSAMVCMNCGSTYGTGNTFCAVCGQKLVAQYPTTASAVSAPVQTAADVQTNPDKIISESDGAEHSTESETTSGVTLDKPEV